jgi:APA family basic amino acid/polyamine antiporter
VEYQVPPVSTDQPRRVVGYFSATAIVVANMVGTGVFATLGLQAELIPEPGLLLVIWLIGGLIALCGALCYGELAAALPRSGGEYHFLGRIYHPILGMAAGLISVTVGFAAPVALAAMAFGRYAAAILPVSPTWTAVTALVGVTLFHVRDVRIGQKFQIITTAMKLLLIVVFIAAGLWVMPVTDTAPPVEATVTTSGMALALVFVFYAYSGWNAAVYVTDEIEQPQRVLPRALLHGTCVVTAAYLLLNLVFLNTVPLSQLAGTVEIGALSAEAIFGVRGGAILSGMLCLLLISTISAMVMAGPRVLQVAGEDIALLRSLAKLTRRGAPARAILLQQVIALLLVATASFDAVLSFAGFTLTLMAALTAMGVIVLRIREPELPRPWKTWGYPATPLVFAGVSGTVLIMALQERPLSALAALAIVLLALGIARRHYRAPGTRP